MISFRQIKDSDILFVEKVYRSTREKGLSLTNWPEEQKNAFIIMQSMAQEAEYKKIIPALHLKLFYTTSSLPAVYIPGKQLQRSALLIFHCYPNSGARE